MPRLRGMEHVERGGARHGVLAKTRSVFGRACRTVRPPRPAGRSAQTAYHGPRGVRSRAGRRTGSRFRDPDGRRSGDRQVHPAAPGFGSDREVGSRLRLCQRGGGDGAGPNACRPAGSGRCAGQAGRFDQRARHPDDAGADGTARPARDRFDPDDAFGHDRGGARHGQPGARLCVRTDPVCQGERRRARAGRTRDERWQHRRSARARTHGRCGDELRGRTIASVPYPARAEEPVRRGGRDRRVLHGERGAGGGRQPFDAVPVRA